MTSDPDSQSAPQDPPESPIPAAEAYVIPAALAQATLNYLASQPYREVFALVHAFEGLEPLPESPTAGNGSA
jgi:hypothetical protein